MLAASLNETPCFRKFDFAFFSSHSKRTEPVYLPSVHLPEVNRLPGRRTSPMQENVANPFASVNASIVRASAPGMRVLLCSSTGLERHPLQRIDVHRVHSQSPVQVGRVRPAGRTDVAYDIAPFDPRSFADRNLRQVRVH